MARIITQNNASEVLRLNVAPSQTKLISDKLYLTRTTFTKPAGQELGFIERILLVLDRIGHALARRGSFKISEASHVILSLSQMRKAVLQVVDAPNLGGRNTVLDNIIGNLRALRDHINVKIDRAPTKKLNRYRLARARINDAISNFQQMRQIHLTAPGRIASPIFTSYRRRPPSPEVLTGKPKLFKKYGYLRHMDIALFRPFQNHFSPERFESGRTILDRATIYEFCAKPMVAEQIGTRDDIYTLPEFQRLDNLLKTAPESEFFVHLNSLYIEIERAKQIPRKTPPPVPPVRRRPRKRTVAPKTQAEALAEMERRPLTHKLRKFARKRNATLTPENYDRYADLYQEIKRNGREYVRVLQKADVYIKSKHRLNPLAVQRAKQMIADKKTLKRLPRVKELKKFAKKQMKIRLNLQNYESVRQAYMDKRASARK